MDTLTSALRRLFGHESAPGIALMLAALAALVISNTPLAPYYEHLLETHFAVLVDGKGVDKPLLLWINDGLMAVFFFLIGLELKREVLEGDLAEPSQIVLPAIGAAGGFVVPVLVFLAFNHDDAMAAQAWAVPAATDIAFALGVLAMLGPRVPLSLRLFLTSLAIFDDLAAIIVIALFYTDDLSLLALALAAGGAGILIALNRGGVRSIIPYALVGLFIWVAVLKSGVHATLAGVVVALTIPIARDEADYSPLDWLEHALHPWVSWGVLPLFAFANAGVPVLGLTASMFLAGLPLGIALGLFVGKQLGVFVACALAIRAGIARLPEGAGWAAFHGVCVLAGVGFTMSLFIGGLAFERGEFNHLAATRIGVLTGSLASALLGAALLRRATREPRRE
ncbi:MAG: Na+/H+ antiporter NhaA [Gammaproteobacteria bacterium]|nr:Na+/H+ antiporter NhaA [Gammaproteobacteria bacterium]MCP5198775.1 Na+/H+ antiporter NhaA [Gammaproteobacteria bacterium]